MKKILVGIAALIVATPLVAGAQANRSDTTTTRQRDTTKQRESSSAVRDTRPAWRNEAGLHESSDIIGTHIKNMDGKDVGKIEKLLIDPQTGKVSDAVVSLGGVLGVGGKNVVVPWSDLKMAKADHEGRKATITMDQAKLDSAPRYERTARADRDRSPAASPRTTDSDKDGKRDSADRAPHDPTKK
ncbi:MAG TPA: PRC-barrel domain-containing protein [Methylomirabilota bacterium]|jgi:sporulation protein YlmC with PRC-barrel domain|nr:PRC-barrel domain-containing protein [Methylomirabilota bacterium]